MDSKKIAQLIKVIVEVEVAKKQEQFLSKTFPKILEEEVNRRVKLALKEIKGNVSSPTQQVVEEYDPFALAESMLQKDRQVQKTNQKQFTKNQTINEILNQTKPFSASERNGTAGFGGNTSVLDKFQQPVNEGYVNSHIPNYMDAEPDIDETISYTANTAPMGMESMRAQMAAKMGYGDIGAGARKGGLGITTGLAGLDRILNRDNSELVKRFKK